MNQDEEVFLRTGAFYFGRGRTRVRTLLGSCVAITIWHPKLRIGGICHYLLSNPPTGSGNVQLPGMYAAGALRMFMREIEREHTAPDEYVVKVFGGGNMFSTPAKKLCDGPPCTPARRLACHDVACKNVETGRALLQKEGFKISQEDVGGVGSRQIVFDLWTGDVWVRRGPELTPAS
jgi:chemotaxis protein CheD